MGRVNLLSLSTGGRLGGGNGFFTLNKSPNKGNYNNINSSEKNCMSLNLIHFNCRGLASEERVYESEQRIRKIKWSIVGIVKTKRKGEKICIKFRRVTLFINLVV